MTGVLRGEGADDQEPTQGAWPCLLDSLRVDRREFQLLEETLYLSEYNYFDVLVYRDDDIEAFLVVFSSLDCLQLVELHIRGCGDNAMELLKAAADWPEVSRVIMEGSCLELVVPADPPLRVEKALEKLGVNKPLQPLGFRVSKVME